MKAARLFALAFALCLRLAARDWSAHPAVVEIETQSDIYAVGDVHSDAARLARLLIAAGLADAEGHWRGGSSVLIFVGDMIDKGPRAVDTLRLIQALGDEAPRQGGRVVALMGNHEAEFLAGPDPTKAAGTLADLKAHRMTAADLAPFFSNLPMAARINDWFFSHAGNTAGRTLAKLRSDLEEGVNRNGFHSAQLLGPDSLLEARLAGRRTWFASRDEKQLLAAYARALGAAHIVEGHQHNQVIFSGGIERKTGEMFQRYGILFLIDVGMSEGVGDSRGAILHIARRSAEAICPSGLKTPLWDARANPDAGRAAPCR